MTQDMLTLGFDQIIEQLKEQAVSQAARRLLADTEPILNEGLCHARMEETTAARRVIENTGTPPLAETEGTDTGLAEALQGGMLLPAQLTSIARFCAAVRRLRRYALFPIAYEIEDIVDNRHSLGFVQDLVKNGVILPDLAHREFDRIPQLPTINLIPHVSDYIAANPFLQCAAPGIHALSELGAMRQALFRIAVRVQQVENADVGTG